MRDIEYVESLLADTLADAVRFREVARSLLWLYDQDREGEVSVADESDIVTRARAALKEPGSPFPSDVPVNPKLESGEP